MSIALFDHISVCVFVERTRDTNFCADWHQVNFEFNLLLISSSLPIFVN